MAMTTASKRASVIAISADKGRLLSASVPSRSNTISHFMTRCPPLPGCADHCGGRSRRRSEEHTSELPSLMRISYAVFCLKKKKKNIYDVYTKSKTSRQYYTNQTQNILSNKK